MSTPRLSIYTHLSSIMEMMARTALTQVCKLVEEDSAGLRSELSRALGDNAALAERLRGLECELTGIRSEVPPELLSSTHRRTIGVQAGDPPVRGDCCVIEDPTIDGIFGKEWCMNLWKDRDPYSLERVIHSTQCFDKTATAPFSGPVDVTEIKVEAYEEDVSCQRETLHLDTGEEEAGGPSIEYSLGDEEEEEEGAGGPSLHPEEEEEVEESVPAGLEEHPLRIISLDGMEEEYDAHLVPLGEDDEAEEEEGDVQFIEEPGGGEAFDPPTTSDAGGREQFTCPVCARAFFHKGSLTRHMKSHAAHFCQICKQHFPARGGVPRTHACVPPVPPVVRSSQGGAAPPHHSCDLCGKVFANPSAVRVHYVVHTGEKPHVCHLCGKRFTQKGNLKCHVRIHTGERPFRCAACGKTFTQKVNLDHHLMAHRNSQASRARKAEPPRRRTRKPPKS